MTEPLHLRFELAQTELLAFVGAGGKTTTMRLVGGALAAEGRNVVLTTTTKMAADQVEAPVCWIPEVAAVDAAFERGLPLYLARAKDGDKVVGFSPETIDTVFASSSADYVLVEADGARRKLIKAPAAYEPVIPSMATTVGVVVGASALGQPIGATAHRPERITHLSGLSPDDLLTPEGAAAVLLHPDGGLKGVPDAARVVMVVARVTSRVEHDAGLLAAMLAANPRVDAVVPTGN